LKTEHQRGKKEALLGGEVSEYREQRGQTGKGKLGSDLDR